jgi:hypothetical protein
MQRNITNSPKVKVLFIHHSTGGNLLNQGRVREEINRPPSSIALWDHGYNLNKVLPSIIARIKFLYRTGLSDPNGKPTGTDYNINLNNDNPSDYERIFTSPSERETRCKILQFDVIIFKKCFPTSQIESDVKLDNFKMSYLKIREFIDKNPRRLFIIMTQPPLRSEVTSFGNASRSRNLAEWLKSDEYVGKRKNLRIFDFFGLLADEVGENKNMLKREYASWLRIDSHPNRYANKMIAPVFSKFIESEIAIFKK